VGAAQGGVNGDERQPENGIWGFQAAYFKGYEYWSNDSSDKRQQVYRALKSKPNSLYGLPWDLALQRAW
jgi:hypothetical protein